MRPRCRAPSRSRARVSPPCRAPRMSRVSLTRRRAMYSRAVTLSQFLEQEERKHPEATGEFTNVLMDIALASKMINREVIRAGLVDVLGYTGQLAVLASEEDENVIPVPEGQPVGKYVVNFDPLDGSSNINANVNIGTIFSILPRVTRKGGGGLPDCLQP